MYVGKNTLRAESVLAGFAGEDARVGGFFYTG